ncbi:MAG: hypothetical protein LUE93_13640, partial [Bacteroides sp.]|nr:hypothetical protein [Bacteroides sp.]
MKYKLHILQTITPLALLLLFSCSEKETAGTESTYGELTLSSYIDERNSASERGYGDTFFRTNDEIRVTIQSDNPTGGQGTYPYFYGEDGIFRGNPAYRFSPDDTPVTTLQAVWPADASNDGHFIDDQREFDNHRRGDWLVATASTSGIMPTNIPVPLTFNHNNALLEFELVGQNSQGLNIEELLIELEVGDEPIACWAYCGNDNGRASLIVPAGTRFSSSAGYLIGTIYAGSSSSRYTIIMPQVDYDLQAGMKYLVSLTPRGYNLEVYIRIGGWNDDLDAGIGIPLYHPTEEDNGDYIVRTGAQLITMSYLMRHYYDGTTIAWPTLTYTIESTLELTEEEAALYIPIPRSLFTGTILYNGESVTSIPY